MNQQNITTLIQKAFQDRRQINPRFSLRSFARALEVSPARLSRIINAKDEAGHRFVATLLKSKTWSEEELSVLSQCARQKNQPRIWREFAIHSQWTGLL